MIIASLVYIHRKMISLMTMIFLKGLDANTCWSDVIRIFLFFGWKVITLNCRAKFPGRFAQIQNWGDRYADITRVCKARLKKKEVSMTRKCHNHILHTKLRHREEKAHDIKK